ncbi:MAG: ATP-binding protein [Bacteroidales bacterium]|nr:ATP-binding protein [Bacteroidales bacterium]
MKRDIDEVFRSWKKEANRYPLLVRGARQVGKSYSIKKFGENEFDNMVEVNFEQKPQYNTCFDTLEPKIIIENLSVLSKSNIIPGKTLLFFDEIQDCPNAISALRYFYEQMPELHVIGAGSLLEFAISQEDFRMPVGRVQYLYMKPLSFLEFLDSIGENRSRKIIETSTWDNLPSPVIHKHLISLIRKYSIIGGMPAVVSEYASTSNLDKCFRIQTIIIQTYRDDFGKYASKVKHKYLEKIFFAVPKMIGRKFKYSHVDASMQSRDLKGALELLEKAGVVLRIKQTSGEGLPLEANAKERHFKTIFLDIGLMQNMCGLSSEILFSTDESFIKVNEGAIAEQLTAQELLAYRDYYLSPALFYWAREARNSSAEIDYIIPSGSYALPIEVKAGKTGSFRSMHIYLEKYHLPAGIRISQLEFNKILPIISIPFYAIKRIAHLTQSGIPPFFS